MALIYFVNIYINIVNKIFSTQTFANMFFDQNLPYFCKS